MDVDIKTRPLPSEQGSTVPRVSETERKGLIYAMLSQQNYDETILKWVLESKSLNILIFGKVGAGKSSLINTLLNEKVAVVGHTIFPETVEVESYTGTVPGRTGFIKQFKTIINDIRVTLWDTPGLQDPTTDDNDEPQDKHTLGEIAKVCGGDKIDLFVYCCPIDQVRLTKGDVDAIHQLSVALGERVWVRAIIALTSANKLSVDANQSFSNQLKARVEEWKGGLHSVVAKYATNINVKGIPVVPTGNNRDELLNGEVDWFTPFWDSCLLRVSFESIPAFLRANKETWIEIKERIAAKVISNRLKEIGDTLECDFSDIGPEGVLDTVAAIIEMNESNIIVRACHAFGSIFGPIGGYFAILITAAVIAGYVAKQKLGH